VPTELLFAWLMVLLRATGIILFLPTLGARPLPATLRVGLAALISTLLYGLVPHGTQWNSLGAIILAAAGELLLGLVMGFVGRFVFAGVEMAGRMITQEIGLIAAPGIDAPAPSTEPLASFMATFAGVLFFLLGGHLGALTAFVRSFEFAPAGLPAFSRMTVEYLVVGTGKLIELGLRISAPFIAMNFLTTLALSVLGRAVPKMSIFVLSAPLNALVGFFLLGGVGALLGRYLAPEFDQLPFHLLEIVAR
jgi:flagellar biosynthetic protein FliR